MSSARFVARRAGPTGIVVETLEHTLENSVATNDVILLTDMVERSRQETASLLPAEQEAFFVAKHYLRKFKPAHDDLLSGIVEGSHDGGIDALYLFANGRCVRDDTDLRSLGSYVPLDLFLLQVKNTTGFGESAIDRLIVNMPDLFNFGRDEKALAVQFNSKVLEITRRFLTAYRRLEMPSLSIYCAFASLRATHLHDNTKSRGERLAGALKGCFGSARTSVEFLDASGIYEKALARPVTNRKLVLSENPISTDMAGGYIGVVKLKDYQQFIMDQAGNLDAGLFEANVRDYEGETDVNRSIQATLEHDEATVDFWWLNNGVTIVADKVQNAGKLLELESPQVVNGLQTSYEVYKSAHKSSESFAGVRSLLVKVIQADEDRVKDRIIRATNSQTTLAISSLRATDKVQRLIEEHLKSVDLFYERRKNYYHLQNMPVSKLVSIDQMGQAVLSVLIQLPHIARGESSRIFENDIYDEVFSEKNPIAMYSNSILIQRRCEDFLRYNQKLAIADYGYYLAMAAGIVLVGKNRPNAADLAAVKGLPRNELLQDLLHLVQESFSEVVQQRGELLLDRIAKDKETTKYLQQRVKRYLAGTRR